LHVARFYGIETGGIRPISPIEVPAFWRDRREELVRFSEAKTSLIHELSLRLLPFLIQFSAVIGLPLDQVVAAAVGFRVERNLMKYAYQENELIPKRERRAYAPYKGALVSGPEQGLHANIAVMDFSSMYPSLMIKYNVSPDTYVPPGAPVPEDGVHTIPEVGHRFLRSPDGFYRKVLTRLIEVRRAIRDRMGEYPPTSPVRKLLDHRQKVVKVVTNATYGYAGWIGARWYVRQVAEATTALGREAIRRAMSIAEDAGLRVLYADTDGLMVAYEPDKIREFTRRIEEEVGLRIKPDKIYDCVLFTRAKKKYAGLEPDGSLDIVGFESVRGDWAQVARDAQREAIEILLKEGSVEKVRSRLERVIRKVRGGEVPFERFIIWKTLTKPIEKYKARTPHGFAAKRLFEVGGKLEAGDKIGFVVVKGHGALYKRAVPYALASYDDIDFDYYVTKQIVPLVERCLEPFEEARRLAP
ncbi:TPA: DNA polymerase II, partial [Candidatus Bathyarchaeota archaeon]|nr:DNA polymerase II [Candidatus Bathyarchaeota archaeon]